MAGEKAEIRLLELFNHPADYEGNKRIKSRQMWKEMKTKLLFTLLLNIKCERNSRNEQS
jgi:hypothetical protein